MLIDWFTVGAQALNFLVLVWLMRRFLYKPVLQAIDAREQRIAAELANAATSKKEAAAERTEFQRKNAEFEQQREALFAKVSQEAEELRKKLSDESATDAAARREKWRNSLAAEQHTLHATLTRKTRDEVFAISRKTLADLADTTLEQAIARVLIRRLGDLKPEDRNLLQAALSAGATPRVRSAFELGESEREALQQTVDASFDSSSRLEFETSPELISGIELSVEGHKVAWSIGEYLSSLEESVQTILKPSAQPEV